MIYMHNIYPKKFPYDNVTIYIITDEGTCISNRYIINLCCLRVHHLTPNL